MAQSIEQIGKYQIVRRLGGGGMAEVFSARLLGVEGFARPVALKRVLPGYAQDGAFASMFIQEAQLSARFHHPNVVSVVDFDRDPEHGLFLAMELVEGRDLNDLMHTGLLPIPLVIYLVAEVLRGLGYAHNLPPDDSGVRGVVHRDVSPHNVLLSWEGEVKVSDFGIAKARGAATSASASLMIKGKPAYMSPEQANGAKLDGRSDLFAVGVMLWEMLVGRPLFAGSGTMQEMFAALFFKQIPAPHQERAEVPEDLSAVTLRLLARPREQRYATAEDAVDALLSCAAASRSGRAELISVLAERFPGQSPRGPSRQLAAVMGTPTPETVAIATAPTRVADRTAPSSRAEAAAPKARRLRLFGAFAAASLLAAVLTLGGARLLAARGEAPAAPPAPPAPLTSERPAPPPLTPTPTVERAIQASSPPPTDAALGPPSSKPTRAPSTEPTAPGAVRLRRGSGRPSSGAKTGGELATTPGRPKPPEPKALGEPAITKPRQLTEAPNLLEGSEP